MAIEGIDGLLLDIDGVLAVSWEPIEGSIDAMRWIRDRGLPYRLITNTTTNSRAGLARTLREAGFEIDPHEIVTAVVATAAYLRTHHPDAPVFVLSDGDPSGDLDGVDLVATPEDAGVIVIGGASQDFGYDVVNRMFRRLTDGASLIAMHRNRYWMTADGLQMDAGAYVAALEFAAGVSATICGKPAAAYFEGALGSLGVMPDRALMVGDDVTNDVVGAQLAGLTGVLVRTGKFRPSDVEHEPPPQHVIDSLASLPSLLEA